MNIFRKRRKEKEEKRRKEEIQRRDQLRVQLVENTAPSLRILREMKTKPPREERICGVHSFHFNTEVFRIQRGNIMSKLREAEVGSIFFTLGDVGTSREEMDDIRLAAVRADILMDSEELGLVVTERFLSRSATGNVVGSVEL